jgi:glycerol-3-phosphate acyltransferase PlsY
MSYAIGSIPWAFIIVRSVTGEDITTHGTGNVGAMNVRRTTGSWGWFAVAMLADIGKGLVPVAIAKYLTMAAVIEPVGVMLASSPTVWPGAAVTMASVAGAVVGHNYSLWMALRSRAFSRTGKGLATGAGALLAYDWRYFLAVVVVGLTVIALSRYMMAGQVAASATLPIAAWALRSPDWPFALVMGAVVYAAHHRRFMGLLRGEEPRFYIHDRGGPRG